jgi:quercetin dioxygenase-like cupin family protein
MTPASGETIQVGALSVRFLVEAADSNGSASVFECFVPADSKRPVPHSHDAFEETIYGLDGVTTWTVDGRTLDIHPGEAVCIPRGAVCTGSTTTGPRTPSSSRCPPPAS